MQWLEGCYGMVDYSPSIFFFFQAEDGIRDLTVTGVQTCALPIFGPDGQRLLLEAGILRGRRPTACLELGEGEHTAARGAPGRIEHDHVAERRQPAAHGVDLFHLRRRRADHGRRPGIAQNVFHLVGGEGRVDGHVSGAGTQARVVCQGPLEPRFREDGDLLARPESELAQAERQRLHPRRRCLMRDVAPRAIRFVAERGRMPPVGLHGVEEQLGQGTGRTAHGRSLTRKVTGEPGRLALTPRLALAITTTPSGPAPAMSRTFTAASPRASVVTVSAVTSACAVSLVTSVTGPAVVGDVIAKTTGRPASGVTELVASTVSPTSTVSESDSESRDADRWIVSSMGPAANSVSATAIPDRKSVV